MSIELSVITSFQEFKSYSRIWEGFRHKQSDNTVCNSWDWCNTWIEVFFRDKDKLYIHIWVYQNEIIGIIPTYLKNTYPGYELRFIATGEAEKSEVCSEFQDFLLHPSFKEQILTKFTIGILGKRNITAIIFDNILDTSTAYEWLDNLNKKYWIKAIKNSGKRYLIPVEKDLSTQLAAFKSKNTKRHAKKFLADPNWKVRMVNDLMSLELFYNQLITKHNESWNARNKVGVFEDLDFVRFHRDFSKSILENKSLVAFELIYKTESTALFYGIIDGNTLYYYQSAINHESQLSSAGIAMHVVALNIARDNNLAFYDLMKGSNNSYKNRYIKSEIKVVTCSLNTLRYKVLTSLIKLFHKVTNSVRRIVNFNN